MFEHSGNNPFIEERARHFTLIRDFLNDRRDCYI
jgi:hypothetical protein